MVFLETWDEFAAKAQALFAANPAATRYTLKYTHNKAEMVVKVTDDVSCLKFKTDQANDLKRVLAFNQWWFGQATGSAGGAADGN